MNYIPLFVKEYVNIYLKDESMRTDTSDTSDTIQQRNKDVVTRDYKIKQVETWRELPRYICARPCSLKYYVCIIQRNCHIFHSGNIIQIQVQLRIREFFNSGFNFKRRNNCHLKFELGYY